MNKYQEVYKKYLTDEITDVEALEQLLLLADARSSEFWELLKARVRIGPWGSDIRKAIDDELKDYF